MAIDARMSEDDISVSSLQLAAKGGMLVKLHLSDGCDMGLDIPVKNLLSVNSKKETLLDQARISTMRHCALNQLFKYSRERYIPEYARNNFYTLFTVKEEGNNVVELSNDAELTKLLEDAATRHMMDDNDNVILHVHCQFINQYRWEAERVRVQATAAADNVVKTLREWIVKASRFVSEQSARNTEDYVIVAGNHAKKHHEARKSHENRNKSNNHPMEWASRFFQALLEPPHKDSFRKATPPRRQSKRLYDEKDDDELVAEIISSSYTLLPTTATKVAKQSPPKKIYDVIKEDDDLAIAIENVASTLVKGFTKTAIFVTKAIDTHLQKKKSNNDLNNSFHLSASSISPSPSMADASITSTSSSSLSCSLEIGVEESVEVICGTKTCTEDIPGEWKIFLDEADDREEADESDDDIAVVVDTPCTDDVISLSSDEGDFETDACAVSCSDSDDDASWAVLDDA